jgi:hypothetical protein
MTIAACYISNEGVVLGADSTSTFTTSDGLIRHYNNEQKLFEVGEMGSTLGLVTWGLGALPNVSYRQLAAQLSDDLMANEPQTVQQCAERWRDLFWPLYAAQLAPQIALVTALAGLPAPTPQQAQQLAALRQALLVGFCIGGHVRLDRRPVAFVMVFQPESPVAPSVSEVQRGQPLFAGVPNLINRLIRGIDEQVFTAILASGLWHGTPQNLEAIVRQHSLGPQTLLPIREAIDWIHSSIFITIKAVKFSKLPAICGGPIEVAVITSDRRFRWVCHKGLDQALTDHSARGTY